MSCFTKATLINGPDHDQTMAAKLNSVGPGSSSGGPHILLSKAEEKSGLYFNLWGMQKKGISEKCH